MTETGYQLPTLDLTPLNIVRMRNNHVLASQLSTHEHMNTFSSLNHENKAGDTHQVI